jgi:hypothetical protein
MLALRISTGIGTTLHGEQALKEKVNAWSVHIDQAPF